ncbi:MAG: ORF6N domain-containing protein [Deltaproteobacteria bacterium]|nr:ORF6N domain-containing protein [Deltaproteobacteria bacterium]MBW2033519.1 ORF6N domain-containing protein [Deltaproteobacteria bacterium]
MTDIVPVERITDKIFLLRGKKVLIDRDLAHLYGVETRVLIQGVKRNIERFPSDFTFQLTQDEFDSLRSQIVISKGKGGRRYLPYVFTEQGVAMLSSVLRSKRAIEVNIAIMRAFVKLREMLATHKELARKLQDLEQQLKGHDEQIQTIFEAIQQLLTPPQQPRKKIGFEVKEPRATYGKRTKGSRKKK